VPKKWELFRQAGLSPQRITDGTATVLKSFDYF